MNILLRENFDREMGLRDLLIGIDTKKLYDGLCALLGAAMCLKSRQGEVVLGDGAAAEVIAPVTLCGELEPVGFIETRAADDVRIKACIALLELLLCSAKQYNMTSRLHVEAMHADYEKLLQKHAALLESEARYKTLAENLEARVAEQVETIENAQRQLYQAEKMASVGQLAAGVAHEINNPIGFIASNLNTAQFYVQRLCAFGELMRQGRDGASLQAAWAQDKLDFAIEDFGALLKESAEGAERISRIVADLKGFSNVDRAEEMVADVNDSIRRACNVAAGNIKDHAEIKLDLGELSHTRCYPGRLSQVFLNLLLNAGQAMTSFGAIRIQSTMENNEIVVRIADNGCGIPEDVLPRIFDPFFTTKDVGQGTGLGLSVSHDIVKAHGGRIKVDSQIGVGAVFTIYLPVRS
ncbi:MAG: ATP-binding protein [Pseudomonadota bacterium]